MTTSLTSALAAAVLLAACGDDAPEPIGDLPVTLVNPLDVWAFSPTDAWFVDGTPTIHRFDGTSWSMLSTGTVGVSCIFALSAADVWLCANDAVVHYDGSTFTALDVAGSTGLDGITAIWASAPTDVWVVGDDAIVAHFNGTTWQRTIVGAPFKTSIWGSSPTDIYTVSTFDLFHYDGQTWTEVELDGGGASDGEVWGSGPSDVWLMGGDTLWHFDGAAWTSTELELLDLTVAWGTGPKEIWGAGSFGSIARFDGSWHGLDRQQIGAPYLRQMLAVHGSSKNDVWFVGRQLGEGGSTGLIYHLP